MGGEGAAACCGAGRPRASRAARLQRPWPDGVVGRATCAIGPSTLQVVVPEGAEPGDTLTLAMTG